MKRVIAITAVVVAAAAGYWALAQPAPAQLPAIVPAGALVYLEAKDFGALVADWNGSAEKRTWLASANYQAFSRSSLFLKLGQAQTEFAAAAGLPADYALLGSVAGGNSALAIYNIGDLEFLYVTRLASARAVDTALWKSRGTYQTRTAGGVTYYLKEDAVSRRTAAFAYTGGMLLLATKGDLIAGALELIAQTPRPSIASESWFSDAVKAAAPGANQLRMVYNLERLIATPHFRSYWIQRNVSDLREFRCGLADLERASRGEMRERRVLLRAERFWLLRLRMKVGGGPRAGAGSRQCGVLEGVDVNPPRSRVQWSDRRKLSSRTRRRGGSVDQCGAGGGESGRRRKPGGSGNAHRRNAVD